MIFDLILLIMIIVSLTRAKFKGCTEDLNFAILFFFIIRLSGTFYRSVSQIFLKITDSESLALVAAYVTLAILLYLVYHAAVGQRVIELGKKIPKTTGIIMVYFFSALRTMMVFSIIFGLIYSHPTIKEAKTGVKQIHDKTDEKTEVTKKPVKWIAPKSYRMTYAFLGEGTAYLFQNMANYLTETVKAPVEHMVRQKEKNIKGSQSTLDAVISQGLDRTNKKESTKTPLNEKTPEEK